MSTPTPSPSMRAVLERLATEDRGLLDPTTLAPQAGRHLADLTNMRWNEDLPPVAQARTLMHADLPARLVVPENNAGREAILHVHGGGWAFCSAATHEGAARRLANATGARVLTVEYRLAPEHPYPQGLEDVLAAWAARDRSLTWSVAGDSAGANLALAAMVRLIEGGAAPQNLPRTALLFYGVYGADFTTPSYEQLAEGPGLTRAKMQRYWNWYAPQEAREAADVAPLAASDTTLTALPPLYLNAAELDPLRSDTELLAARLSSLGRKDVFDLVPGVVHGFMQMGSALEEARAAFKRAGTVFKQGTA
ncbi:MAG: esterase [Stappia sp.]|uniref:alpha/beta hydrolase n=1 Tax=Stappia sp. TaxID=1870903 RepID=UPI000C48E397|nr:alpha/beta hydrolase [Stappia sp.]MAB00829.1 esterase [Stappia sp.]MBM18970.1 esterase [Stappia sp.]